MTEPTQPIKLIALDIDGTLLDPHRQIAPRTRQSIQAAQAAGIIVTLATARRYVNGKHLAHELGIEMPLVLYDGALIMHHPDERVLQTNPLPASIAQQAIEVLVRHRLQPVLQRIQGTVEETLSGHSEFDNPGLDGYFTVFPNVSRLDYTELGQNQPDPLRVVAFASEEAIAQAIPDLAHIDCAWGYIKRGNYGCAELTIMHNTCSKAAGVTALADYLHIPLEQVMAIGDNTNDIDMLQAVGWGVAMGQAAPEIQAIAKAVTSSNAEDGVARAIERYALRSAANAASNSRSR